MFLHVANGSATTRLINPAGIPGRLSIWADPLHEGPVPANVSDDELVDIRMRYLAGGEAQPAIDPENDLRVWRQRIADHASYGELVLWYEYDLFDQLNLIQLLSWIRGRLPVDKPVSLICIGAYPGRPNFKGLGELTPAELAPLFETRQRVTDEQYDVAKRAWAAFRQPSPEPLDALRRGDTSALPFLGAALKRLLEEYPWTIDGLSRTERRLLELAAAGPADLWTVFGAMYQQGENYHVTDGTLAELVAGFAGGPHPLVTFSPTAPAEGVLPQGTVAMTAVGRSVLAGRQDYVGLCGVDRWLGGVHLTGNADEWRWDGEKERVTRWRTSQPPPGGRDYGQ